MKSLVLRNTWVDKITEIPSSITQSDTADYSHNRNHRVPSSEVRLYRPHTTSDCLILSCNVILVHV